jgi:DHA3 family tetracycline resistance protein-like MFS transporter
MQHGYDQLDRAGGFSRVRILAPLRHRDFRLLWAGMCVSLIGDGLFIVALAWQVYALSDSPGALATVMAAMTVPTIACLLLGGALSDRLDRRRVMLCADCVRAAALGALATLSLMGELRLWHLFLIGAIYGAAAAFFDPSFDAIVPDLLPGAELPQANSLDQLVRPIALRMLGPALGGVLVAGLGAGVAFALDAGSFLVSAAALLAMRSHYRSAAPERESVVRQIGVGLRYVRSSAWLWVTFATAAVAYLLFIGPTEVLVPFIVKNDLRAGAWQLGVVFATGGLGSLLLALVVGQVGLPRRLITCAYVTWTLATLAVVGYGIAHALWGLMLTSLLFNSLETFGTIAWSTVKQRHVPPALLGRVSSLDWLISIGLLPLSFALTGPVSAVLGVRTTLIAGGALGAVVTFAGLFVPRVRDIDEIAADSANAGSVAQSRAAAPGAGIRVQPAGSPVTGPVWSPPGFQWDEAGFRAACIVALLIVTSGANLALRRRRT